METGRVEVQSVFGEAEAWINAVFSRLTEPWAWWQLLIIASCFALGKLLGRPVEKRLIDRARGIKGNVRLLRIVIALVRRVDWMIFVALLALARATIIASTWPSRALLVSLALSLAATWLVVAVSARILQSRTLARAVAAAVFVYLAAGTLGLGDDLALALDSVAVVFGELRISLLTVLRTIGVAALFLWIAHIVGAFAENRIQNIPDLSPSVQVLSAKLLRIALAVGAGALALTSAGIDLTALTIFSSAIGVGLGFGLQKIVSNFVSGVIILADRSIKPGDTIQLGDTFGWIRELRARFVSIVTRDGREYLIPNEDFITQQVVNWSYSDRFVRIDVDFGVSYDSDPHQVSALAIEAAQGVPRVNASRTPVCWLTAFGESSLDFKLRFWIEDPTQGLTNVRGKVLLALWDAFKREGIAIPYPHRELIVHRKESPAQPGRPDQGRSVAGRTER